MNDFFIASNRPLTVKKGNFCAVIKQFQMFNFDEWSGLAMQIKMALENQSDVILEQILTQHTESVLALCALATEKTIPELEQAIDQDTTLAIELLDAILVINDAFFSEPQPKPTQDIDPRKKVSWFSSFQLLISMGHTHSEIMQMSYGAFRAYLKAAHKDWLRQLRAVLNMHRAAQHAKNNDYKKLLNDLSKEI